MTFTPYRLYVIYDGRACGGVGTDDALVHSCARTLKEARRDAEDIGQGAIYAGTVRPHPAGDGGIMDDEEWVEDWPPQ